MNPESSTNIPDIRRETDNFLDQFPSSLYAPFAGIKNEDVLSDLDIGPFLQASSALGLSQDPYLTGASTACLPMTFRIIDKTGSVALEFTLLVNPSSMNHGKTSTVGASYTREGYITQMWGPNQDLITASGSSAAFMVAGIGLTAVGRRRSFGFLNFTTLLATYRNNGYLLGDPTLESGLTRVVNLVTGVELTYDNQSYMGHFSNFTIDENADSPFRFNYNFDFVVSMLSKNYNEVRGHFASIDDLSGLDLAVPLVGDISQDSAPFQGIKAPTYVRSKSVQDLFDYRNDVQIEYGELSFPPEPDPVKEPNLLPQFNFNGDVKSTWKPPVGSGKGGGGGTSRTMPYNEAEVKKNNASQARVANAVFKTSPLLNTRLTKTLNWSPDNNYKQNLNLKI